jgi:hypothetical protein
MAVSTRGFNEPLGLIILLMRSDIPAFCGFDHLLESEVM